MAAYGRQGQKPTFFENEYEANLAYPPIKNHVRRRRPGGNNVLRKAVIDTKIADDKIMLKEARRDWVVTNWHDKLSSTAAVAAHKRRTGLINQEVSMANEERVMLRRSRLRTLLENEHQQYISELHTKGLSLFYDYS